MIYYLDHPHHGVHIAYTEEDVKDLEKVGWVLRGSKTGAVQEAPTQTGVPKKNKGGRPRKVVQ